MKEVVSIIILVSLFAGCKKYPEDEKLLHLKGAKKRILEHWSLNQVKNHITNTPILISYYAGDILFNSSNDFTGKLNFYNCFNYNGTWELIANRNILKITENNTATTREFLILRLEKDNLKLQIDSLQFIFGPYRGP